MRGNSDYLSEFEREFELEFESNALNNENTYELENDRESEHDHEYEFEGDHESEGENEFEFQNENSYESRLYEILNNNYESELEFENNLNEVLHEMEKDYFFGSLKKWVKKKGGLKGLLAKYAKKLPIVSAANAISSVARGDFRGALKDIAGNSLLKTGLSFIPGGAVAAKGLDMANKFMGEAEAPAVSMDKVKQIVETGKTAYDNLARHLVDAQTPQDAKDMGKKAWLQTMQSRKKSGTGTGASTGMGTKSGNKTVIPYAKGSSVHVYADRVVIYKPS